MAQENHKPTSREVSQRKQSWALEEFEVTQESFWKSLIGPEKKSERLTRKLRILWLDWGPILQLIATCIGIIGLVSLLLNRGPQDGSKPGFRVSEEVPLTQRIVEQHVGWPWGTCEASPTDVNRWLGQGPDRIQVEDLIDQIEKTIPTANRSSEAERLCRALSAGTPSLIKILNHRIVELSHDSTPARRQ